MEGWRGEDRQTRRAPLNLETPLVVVWATEMGSRSSTCRTRSAGLSYARGRRMARAAVRVAGAVVVAVVVAVAAPVIRWAGNAIR